jgi:hypothetical protein
MFSKRLIFTGVVLAAGTVATAGAYASAASSPSSPRKSGAVYLVSSLQGRNEVPGSKGAVGDPDGRAVEVLKVQGSTVTYAVRWQGITAPTEAHIHAGAKGVNGDVKIELFSSPRPGDTARGSVKVTDKKLLASLVADPGSFYANLHTAQFPGGAVRGQLHTLSQPVDMKRPAINLASVVKGAQIYACTKGADGTFSFTQHDVAATLQSGIKHSFVHPDAGPPQWVALDGSAVTGKVVLKTANGAGNIPELDLQATQTGAERGSLAHVDEVLRLNTVGGVAPTGTCDPQATPTTAVPYKADYLFVG